MLNISINILGVNGQFYQKVGWISKFGHFNAKVFLKVGSNSLVTFAIVNLLSL